MIAKINTTNKKLTSSLIIYEKTIFKKIAHFCQLYGMNLHVVCMCMYKTKFYSKYLNILQFH